MNGAEEGMKEEHRTGQRHWLLCPKITNSLDPKSQVTLRYYLYLEESNRIGKPICTIAFENSAVDKG